MALDMYGGAFHAIRAPSDGGTFDVPVDGKDCF